jgi:hypothetical protein
MDQRHFFLNGPGRLINTFYFNLDFWTIIIYNQKIYRGHITKYINITCRSKKNIIVSDHAISHELKLFHNYCICHPVLLILCNVYHMQWCIIYFVWYKPKIKTLLHVFDHTASFPNFMWKFTKFIWTFSAFKSSHNFEK